MNILAWIWMVFTSLIWPPKGIIYAEAQLLMWIAVFSGVTIEQLMPSVIVFFAIYYIIATIIFERRNPFHGTGRWLRRIARGIWHFVIYFVGAWFWLLAGIIVGNDTEVERSAHRRFMRIAHLSLHFRLGRWMTNAITHLISQMPAMATRVRLTRTISIAIALVIALWGIWNLPYDLTH